MNEFLVFTCEHAGNDIPAEYATFFENKTAFLKTHRGYDKGAFEVYKKLSESIPSYSIMTPFSRLLIDCNRSLDNPDLFSSISQSFSSEIKENVIETYYLPYRKKLMAEMDKAIKNHAYILHISVHSFTPILKGVKRDADIGLLYDPGRPHEKIFSALWKKALLKENPRYRVKMNYPYAGKEDGLTTFLRKRYPAMHYIGIELEMNQTQFRGSAEKSKKLIDCILKTLNMARHDPHFLKKSPVNI